MTRFDSRDSHTLICLQQNRGIPERAQECVCPAQLPRTFQPDYGIEGPHEGGPWPACDLALVWAKRGALVIFALFLLGLFGRHFHVI